MVKRKLFQLLFAAVLVLNLFPVCAAYAAEPAVCHFSDTFEDYPNYGSELFSKHWDVVVQGVDTGSRVTVEQDDGNGFAAFRVKSNLKDGAVSSPVVSMKKNGLNNSGTSLVYEGLFYTFDQNAKLSLSLTNSQDSKIVELLTLKGNELGLRNTGNLVTAISDTAAMKAWNRISVVLDGTASTIKAYLNGERLTEEIPVDLSMLNTANLSLKVAVKNNTGIPYAEGRMHMDDFYVYEGTEPVEDKKELEISDLITTYLNKQFTSVVTNGRAHGVASFYSTVNIIDSPNENNKSASILLGKDGAGFPLEQTAEDTFSARVIYKANRDVTLFARDSKGKENKLITLAQKNEFSTVNLLFDFAAGKCTVSGQQEAAEFSLDNVAFLGFYGEGTELILNKFFAYSGAEQVEDSYFKDYSYQKKAIIALVTQDWTSCYQTLSQGVFLGIDFYQASVFGNKLRLEGQPPRVFNGVPYVPLEDTVFFLGGELLSGEEEGAAICFSTGGNSVAVKQEDIYRAKDTNYVTAQYLADAFGLKLSWDGSYLLSFGTKQLFTATQDTTTLTAALHYERPSGEEIFDRIEKNGGVHPRILADAARIAEVKENINRYPTLKQWYDKLKTEADSYLDAYALYFTKPDGIRLLSVSNLMVSRMWALGFVYKMTGDTRYAEAAWRDLEAVSKFNDWNPSHYLDVTTMSHGVAMGYSWFYDYLTDEQKDIIVKGFVKCGLTSYINALDKREWWTIVNSNWNPWCHGGLVSGIIAMSDRLGDDAKYALDRAFPYMEYLYPEFVPDGAWAEGTAYHATTLNYISEWCENLKLATGKDYGYWDLPGMDRTAYFGDALSGNGGVYNYGDNTATRSDNKSQEWFAAKYKDPALAQLRYNNMLTYNFPTTLYDLLMTRPEMLSGSGSEMDQDIYYKNMQIVSMRTSWEDMSEGIFVAAKGGDNGASHAHFDIGGFVMDVGGVRFAYELGRDSYSLVSPDNKVRSYKKRTEGHNTYVINPSDDPGQIADAVSEVVKFETKPKGGFAVIDMTPAYVGARDMKRGFLLTNDRQTLVIQDEVELSTMSEIYWFMHTRGDIQLSEDGKSVFVTYNGVTVRLDILDTNNADATFEVRAALPLETSPWLEGQSRNEEYKKLVIHWDSVQKYTLAVAVSQVIDPDIPVETPVAVPISDWKIEDGEVAEKPTLTAITRNGVKLEDFSPNKYSYIVQLPYDVAEKPVYEFFADDNMELTVKDCETISGQTKVILKDKINNTYALYTINTKIEGYIGILPGAKEAEIVNVTASAEPEYEQGNRATCLLDGDYMTRWTAENDAWAMLELKEPVEVYAVGVMCYLGDQRKYLFDLEVSEDGENWTPVYSGNSSGTTNEMECFLLGGVKAKYVRYQGHAHSAGSWNNISELRVYVRE